VADLAKALTSKNIRLLVYLPSGAPAADHVARKELGWRWGKPGGWQLPGEPGGGRLAAHPVSRHEAWEFEAAVQRLLGFEVFRVWLPGAEYRVAGSLGIAWGEEHTGHQRVHPAAGVKEVELARAVCNLRHSQASGRSVSRFRA
jgi:hypothetical protein